MNSKFVLFFLAFLVVSGCAENNGSLTAQKRLDLFYEKSMPEDSLIPFLVEGGEELIPFLIADMQKKDAPKRRYIIGAAGELRNERVLPTLISIALDSSEEDYFRCDALKAINQIKPKHLDTITKESKEAHENFILQCDKY